MSTDDDDILWESPPAARGGVARTDWAVHLQPILQNPRRTARVKIFREFSHPPQMGPDGKPLKDSKGRFIPDTTKDKVFDQRKSNSRAATLASGIRDANLGKPGSLRLPNGGWDAVSRANGVWARYYPPGESFVTLTEEAKMAADAEKAAEEAGGEPGGEPEDKPAEEARQVPPDAPADHVPVNTPVNNSAAHTPEPARVPESARHVESAIQETAANEARAAFPDGGSEEVEW